MEFLDECPILAFFGRRLHRVSACPATTRVRKRGPCPRSRLPVASIALRQWCGGRKGCSASMTAWAFGAVPKPTGRRMPSVQCHSKPPFVMIRISFEGCLSKSLCTASVDFPGLRAQTHSTGHLRAAVSEQHQRPLVNVVVDENRDLKEPCDVSARPHPDSPPLHELQDLNGYNGRQTQERQADILTPESSRRGYPRTREKPS